MLRIVLLLTVSGLPSPADRSAEIEFVQRMQTPSGGFITDLPTSGSTSEPTLRTTRTGLRALRLLDGPPANREAVIRFLYGCYDSQTGGFAARPGLPPDPISTSVGLMIHRELGLPTEDLMAPALEFMNAQTTGFEQIRMVAPCLEEFDVSVPRATEWLGLMDKMRNPDGAYGRGGPGQARTTALSGIAALRLGQEIDEEGVLQAMQAGQRADGGFGNDRDGGSDLESCYRVVRLLRRLNAQPLRVDALRDFMARCRNDDGGYGRTPDQPSSLHGTYYVAILRHWLDTFVDDFDDVAAGELPSGWEAAARLDAPGSRWQVVRDPENASGNMLKQVSSEGRNPQFNVCVSDRRYQDAEISVDLRAMSGRIDQGGGIVWRYLDSQNYYIARWNPLESNIRMYKVVDGVRSQLDTAQVAGTTGELHELRIVCVGRDLRAYFDDRLALEAEDDQFRDWGRIGLWTKADAVTEFDNLRSRYTEKFALESF